MGYPVEYGGQDAVGALRSPRFETLAFGDLSLLVKCGVQFGLFGGAVLHLGTERHHERYLRDVASLELPGCFAMTETGHGSNVQALRTTATYDPETQEFVVHTPDDDARKDYIGNAARDGRMAAVFAQLIVGGEERGVHALLVPLRDERRRPCSTASGSRTAAPSSASTASTTAASGSTTCASRARTCSTATRRSRPTATYSSPIENPTKRFFTMLGTLIQGRVSVCGASISATKVALDDRRPARAGRAASSARPGERGGAADGLPHAPAPAAARARHDVRAALRPGAAASTSCTRSSPRERRPTTASGASSRRSPPA